MINIFHPNSSILPLVPPTNMIPTHPIPIKNSHHHHHYHHHYHHHHHHHHHHHPHSQQSHPISHSHHQNFITTPSLSRFLSTSFVNPIYRSRFFSSSLSSDHQNPLFYSTRDSNQIDHHDILPNEDDPRLFSSSSSQLSNHHHHHQPRGIMDHDDNQDDDDDDDLQPHQPPTPFNLTSIVEDDQLTPDYPHPSTHHQHPNQFQDEDPFYDHIPPSNSNHQHRTINLPRHLLASHALSNLVASEISYAHHHPSYHPSNSLPSSHQAHPTPSLDRPGWKIYQSISSHPTLDVHHPSQVDRHSSSSSDPTLRPSSSHPPTSSSRSNPSRTATLGLDSLPNHDLQQLRSELTERPSSHQTHPNPPNLSPDLTDYPVTQIHYDLHHPPMPTVYVYPTEARDIGTDVPGQTSLGPQNYRDSFWIAAWLGSLLYTLIQSIWLFIISSPPNVKDDDSKDPTNHSSLIIKSLPILVLLITITTGICLVSLSFLLLVNRSIKYLVYGTILGVPSTLGFIGLWTWSKSLSDSNHQQPGMGYLSFLSILSSILLMRFMWTQRGRISRTIQVLNLSIGVVIQHPSLVMVSLMLTMACILFSIPFITLISRCLLNGRDDQTQARLIIDPGTVGQVLVTGFVWSWSLNVIRNLQRIIIAGVVSHWYFNRHSPPGGPHDRKSYSAIQSTYESIGRALGPSLGTVCLSAFLLTVFDSSSKMFKFLKKLTHGRSTTTGRPSSHQGPLSTLIFRNPISNFFLSPFCSGSIKFLIDFFNRLFDFLNSFSLIYAGITGFSFFTSFKKIQALLFKNSQINLIHNLLVKLILNLITLTISLTISLIGYQILINSNYNLSSSPLPASNRSGMDSKGFDQDPKDVGFRKRLNENLLPLVLIFFGLLPFWILRFLTDLILNSVDTLFLCWNIDLDIGTNHSTKTREAFVGKLET